MKLLPRDRYQRVLFLVFLAVFVASCINPPYRQFLLMQHVPTILAVECILATSAGYELIEWLVAIVFTPDWADQFLGQQGDMFDAQKDMALATSGAIVSISVLAAWNRWKGRGTQPRRFADGGRRWYH